jgi:hypothetical protein
MILSTLPNGKLEMHRKASEPSDVTGRRRKANLPNPQAAVSHPFADEETSTCASVFFRDINTTKKCDLLQK